MKKSIVLPLVLILWQPLFLVFRVPLEQALDLKTLGVIKVGVTILFIVGLVLLARMKNRKLVLVGMSAIAFTFVASVFSLSTLIFLGGKTGEDLLSKAQGWSKLEVYRKGKCVYSFGGSYGRSEVHYINY